MADVYIVEEHRGKGLGKFLVQNIMDCDYMSSLRRIMLATKDAHSLYAIYGLTPLNDATLFMEKWVPNIYHSEGGSNAD